MTLALSAAALAALALPLAYLYLLLYGALRRAAPAPPSAATPRFAIAIPAHDEAAVIGRTVRRLRELDYPPERVDAFVVADHCTDDTAEQAREAGAACLERTEGQRSGKGAALGWLFERLWELEMTHDAVVVFDADTQVEPGFLRAMAARLAQGEQAIQGEHRISNPDDGWYPNLSRAMFLLNNSVYNRGRANLGFSAVNMGDSICLSTDLLRRLGWGQGLTEDYDLRLRLLLEGVRIAFEPRAIGSGEAPASWAIAGRQRKRWLTGTYHSTRRHLYQVLGAAVRRRDPALWDAAAQMVFPAYSTLTLLCGAALASQVAANCLRPGTLPWGMVGAWLGALLLLAFFPVLGLAAQRAPARAYLAVLAGPWFVLWRTALAIGSRFLRGPAEWVRTPRRSE